MLTTAIKLIVFERELWRAFSETEELKSLLQCPADSQCNAIINDTLTTTQKLTDNAKKLQDLTKNGFCDTKKHHMPKVPESLHLFFMDQHLQERI